MDRIHCSFFHESWPGVWRSVILALSFLTLASCVQVPLQVEQEVRLPAHFTDNMVLQRGARNRIAGWSAPGRQIWVRYKNAVGTARANSSGTWHAELDLRNPIDAAPGKLVVGEGKPEQFVRLELNNVVVGDVWLLGVCNDKGVPLQPAPEWNAGTPKIRFITLTNSHSLLASTPRPLAKWRTCSEEAIQLQELSALSFYFANGLSISLSNGYVGAIQVSPEELVALRRKSGSLAHDRAEFLRNLVTLSLHYAWSRASNEVVAVIEKWEGDKADAILEGRVWTTPRPVQYDHFPAAHLREEFDSSRIPASALSFDGAVW